MSYNMNGVPVRGRYLSEAWGFNHCISINFFQSSLGALSDLKNRFSLLELLP